MRTLFITMVLLVTLFAIAGPGNSQPAEPAQPFNVFVLCVDGRPAALQIEIRAPGVVTIPLPVPDEICERTRPQRPARAA